MRQAVLTFLVFMSEVDDRHAKWLTERRDEEKHVALSLFWWPTFRERSWCRNSEDGLDVRDTFVPFPVGAIDLSFLQSIHPVMDPTNYRIQLVQYETASSFNNAVTYPPISHAVHMKSSTTGMRTAWGSKWCTNRCLHSKVQHTSCNVRVQMQTIVLIILTFNLEC